MTRGRTVERICDWAAGLSLDAVPPRALALCRAQRASVLGAVAASLDDPAARRLVDAVLAGAPDGPAPVAGRERRVRAEEAVYATAALSIALDFDDYGLFGHSGHSAVLVPALLAHETGAEPARVIEAQAVANEVALRLGGACLLGPLNGQLWSFIHAAASALAAGRLLGLDERRLAHALAIALYQAPRPTVPGFMAPDSKLLTASDPAVTGLRAARLARAGVTGPLDVLDHPQGFLGAFAFAPLGSLLTHQLGRGWATETLCVKPYPGCAYVDTTLDAVLSMELPPAQDIASIDVEAGLLTCGMDGMSRHYARGGTPTPVTVTFSVPWNVAIAVVAGRVTPDEVRPAWLRAHARELEAIVSRVRVRHSWELTERTLDAVAPLLSPRAVAARIGPGRLLSALAAMRREHRSVPLSGRDAASFVRWVATAGQGVQGFWDPEALARFRMALPARVTVRTRAGRELCAEVDVPRGGAGHPDIDPVAVAMHKLRTHGPRAWGEAGTGALARAIADDHSLVGELG